MYRGVETMLSDLDDLNLAEQISDMSCRNISSTLLENPNTFIQPYMFTLLNQASKLPRIMYNIIQ